MQDWKAALVVAALAGSLTVSAWVQAPGSATAVQSPGGIQSSSSSFGGAGLPGTTMLPNVPGLAPDNAFGTTPAGTTTATTGLVSGALPGGTSVAAAPRAPVTAMGTTASPAAGGAVTPDENSTCLTLGAALGTATSMPNNCIR
jgi:hypothetical protein